jgi:myo-inositol 2-dehydrogenase/D-chiro-inositol 1-dehydrogenase
VTVGIGLIGAGQMGHAFGHQLAFGAPGIKLAAEVAARLGVAESYTDPNTLLGRRDIEAVVIATPTRTRVELVSAAAAAGKHIFCEKPLALTVAGCDEAIAAVEKAGVQLQVGFMRRLIRPIRPLRKRSGRA